MIVVTTEQIEGKKITETLGLVRGSTIRPGIWGMILWLACAMLLAVKSRITP